MEIVDPKTGALLPEGSPGEIVFTPLSARGTVVVRYRTGDCTDGGLVYEACPHCGRIMPRLVGRISRVSEIREMQLRKLKGTLVDFNQLEHLLDDIDGIGTWQLELRKINDDPMELDELILHVSLLLGAKESIIKHQIDEHFTRAVEITPNQILFHSAEEIRKLHGVVDRCGDIQRRRRL